MTGLEAMSSALLVTGAALAALAGLGLVRFPDVLSRMHAATKPATVGLVLVVAGTGLRMTDAGEIATLVLLVALQLFTAPVGAHLVGRAVRRGGAAARAARAAGAPPVPADPPDRTDPPERADPDPPHPVSPGAG